MKRILAVIMCAILSLNLTACGEKITTAEIEKKIADVLGVDYVCDIDIGEQKLREYYHLDMSKVKEYTAKVNEPIVGAPDTVIVLRVDKGYVGTAVDMLNRGLSETVMTHGWTEKITDARIYTSGNYVVYVIAERAYKGGTPEQRREAVKATYAEIDTALGELLGELSENFAMIPECTSTEPTGQSE